MSFISVKDLAKQTTLSKYSIYELVRGGQIKAVRADKRILVDNDSAQEYFASLPSAARIEAQPKEGDLFS